MTFIKKKKTETTCGRHISVVLPTAEMKHR